MTHAACGWLVQDHKVGPQLLRLIQGRFRDEASLPKALELIQQGGGIARWGAWSMCFMVHVVEVALIALQLHGSRLKSAPGICSALCFFSLLTTSCHPVGLQGA